MSSEATEGQRWVVRHVRNQIIAIYRPILTVEGIARIVAMHYGVDVLSLTQKTRRQPNNRIRLIAMGLAVKYSDASMRFMARFFCTERTSIYNAGKRIAAMEADPEIAHHIKEIREEIEWRNAGRPSTQIFPMTEKGEPNGPTSV